jgi:tyrosinase
VYFKSTDPELKNWTQFNYNYPELTVIWAKEAEERTRIVSGLLVSLYVRIIPKTAPIKTLALPPNAVFGLADLNPPLVSQSMSAPGDEAYMFTDWYIRIRSNLRLQVRMTYSILVFIGKPPDDPAEWAASPNVAGRFSELVNSEPEMCANCMAQTDLAHTGVVTITEFLRDHGLDIDATETVDAYLKDNIHLRLEKVRPAVYVP